MTNGTRELEAAVDAVRLAAQLCRAVQQQIAPESLEKKDRSPVTVADFGSQAIVCRALAEAFPSDPVVGEEDSSELRAPGNELFLDRVLHELAAVDIATDASTACQWIDHGNGSPADRFWTLDPIDGTKGFLRGEQFAISLGLIEHGEIVVAVLACPNLLLDPGNPVSGGSLFVAAKGQGAFACPIDGSGFDPETALRISVSPISDCSAGRLCESVESGHSSHSRSSRIAASLGITRQPVRLDSQAKYAVVARGEADIYLRLPTRADYREKIWDHAGGVLVVTEAGGTVTDITGRPLEFTHGRELSENRGVIVSNGPMHETIVDAVQRSFT